MRLSVFSPESSTQLLIDLAKIYQGYFPPEQLTQESLQALIENEQTQFYVTLFNERHLGALQIQVTEHQAQLSLLSVRDLTRRRGIAKNLLREVEKQLKSEQVSMISMSLKEIPEAEKQGLTLFMQAVGYQLSDSVFTKTL
ncbi:aspartate 1-decarboxylase autocleavage activator PanM [Psychromonas ossibalaenae]|uniref:aspartate 1-decarboxylase autocleavage activator PanM n=1 Tax=Psychromonas ossibalaenae TaxID=444922 RepID=UPI00037689C4|nr:aspartate 1-decarboxylase autocleavage activator PanM [Psychromonas ossibalaenae]